MTNEYEAGYHDGAINYELDHCPACKNISDLQDALDENAKLRELVSLLMVVRKYTISCNPLDCKSCQVEKECREGMRLAKDLGFDYKEIKIPGYPDYKSPDYL